MKPIECMRVSEKMKPVIHVRVTQSLKPIQEMRVYPELKPDMKVRVNNLDETQERNASHFDCETQTITASQQ